MRARDLFWMPGIVALATLTSTFGMAQEPVGSAVLSDLAACEAVENERVRLLCFEAVLENHRSAAPGSPAPSEPQAATVPAEIDIGAESAGSARQAAQAETADDPLPTPALASAAPPSQDQPLKRGAENQRQDIDADATKGERRKLFGLVRVPFGGRKPSTDESTSEAQPRAVASGDAPADFGFTEAEVDRREREAIEATTSAEERRRLKEEKAARERILGVVASISERPDGKRLITLDNGQEWLETDNSNLRIIETGDTAAITKSRFGGFRLSVDARRGYMAVRRLQ